jgi:hypothetical protein
VHRTQYWYLDKSMSYWRSLLCSVATIDSWQLTLKVTRTERGYVRMSHRRHDICAQHLDSILCSTTWCPRQVFSQLERACEQMNWLIMWWSEFSSLLHEGLNFNDESEVAHTGSSSPVHNSVPKKKNLPLIYITFCDWVLPLSHMSPRH